MLFPMGTNPQQEPLPNGSIQGPMFIPHNPASVLTDDWMSSSMGRADMNWASQILKHLRKGVQRR